MQNQPVTQDRVNIDVLANDVLLDVQTVGRQANLYKIFCVIKELHEEQDLFIFSDGSVAATKKGLNKHG